MKPTLFLRIAGVLAIVMAILHTIGGVFGKPDPGPATSAVLAMQSNHFNLTGFDRSYWDFYIGFGIGITISLVAEGIVFWILASLAKTYAAKLRPILIVFGIAYIALAVVAWRYIFLPPMVCELLIAACLLLAAFTAKSSSTA